MDERQIVIFLATVVGGVVGIWVGFREARKSYPQLRKDCDAYFKQRNDAITEGERYWVRAKRNRRRCVAAIDTLRGTRSLLKRAEQRLERLEASERAAKESEKAARYELKRLKDGLYALLNHPEPSLADSVLEDCKKRETPDLKQFNVWRDPIKLDYSEESNGTEKFPVVDVPSENGEAEEAKDDWRTRWPIGSKWETVERGVLTVRSHDESDMTIEYVSEGGYAIWLDQYGNCSAAPEYSITSRIDEVEAPF